MRDHLNFEKRLSFAIFFMAGILGGIFFVIKSKGSLSDHGDLFDASVLYGVKNLKADGRTLFLYIFAKRLSEMCFFALAATTYLGSLCMRGGAVWFGMTFGSYLALSTAQYGMKGFFVALTGLFPQYLIYIPVFWILFLWGENVYRGIYVYRYGKQGVNFPKGFLARSALVLLGLTALTMIGCALETYLGIAPLSRALTNI